MIQLLRKCFYIFQLKVIPQSVKNLVLCGYWNHINPGDRSWVNLNGVTGRVILGLYQHSFKDWKGRFYMITSNEHNPALLEAFPSTGSLKWSLGNPEAWRSWPHTSASCAASSRAWAPNLALPPLSSTSSMLKSSKNTLVCLLFLLFTCHFHGHATSHLSNIPLTHAFANYLYAFLSLCMITLCHVGLMQR